MKIKKLYIKNFKSFGEVDIVFQPINLLIGANASGKSNVIILFEFLKNIQTHGIEEAVSKMGGLGSLLNFNTSSRGFTIHIDLDSDDILSTEDIVDDISIFKKRENVFYELEVNQKSSHFQIIEKITFVESFFERSLLAATENRLSQITYGVINKFGRFETFENQSDTQLLSNGIKPILAAELPFSAQMLATLNSEFKNRSVLEYRGIFIPSNLFQFGIYDIQPHLVKSNNFNANIDILQKDASNLTQVVNQILKKDEETAQQFIASVGGVLDFIKDIRVDRFENLLFLKIKEVYNKDFTDGILISNGTASVIAMIVALYNQPFQISFFEEPEHAIHPALIELLVERLYAHVEYTQKQIFITTHSSEMLKAFYEKGDINNIFLVKRSDKYYTNIENLMQNEKVKEFLQEFGIDELFIQELIK